MSTSSDGRAKRMPQERDQRVPAGEQLRVLAPEQLDRLGDGAGPRVLEGGRDHCAALAADWIARTMLW